MATTLNFDNLNVLDSKTVKKSRAIPYRQYFGEMYITPEEMRSRIRLAEEIEDVMLYVFAYWAIAASAELSIEELRQDAKEKMRSVLGKHTKIDSYLEQHIDNVIDEVIESTATHTAGLEESEAGYWLSSDRAMLIAENEANAFGNYVEYREAKARGKTKKTWITELDDKVRLTHTLEEGKTIDIDGLFFVGGSQMRFPKDTEYNPDASEVVNCRCTCEYS